MAETLFGEPAQKMIVQVPIAVKEAMVEEAEDQGRSEASYLRRLAISDLVRKGKLPKSTRRR